MRKLCAVMLCLAFMLAACQPTPEKQAVIQKDIEQMIEKAQKTPGITQEAAQGGLRERLGAPQRYTADIVDKSGKFYFKADVELTIPEVDAMPMAWVEAANFEQDMVTRLFDALCGDREMYEATSIELSLMRINARDTITKGLLVPVWSVYSEDSNNYNEKTSVLAVNAIDGSIIDLQTGY